MRIRPFFRWYDLWIGVYVDVNGRALYICPIPMFGVKIEWKHRSEDSVHNQCISREDEREHLMPFTRTPPLRKR